MERKPELTKEEWLIMQILYDYGAVPGSDREMPHDELMEELERRMAQKDN